MKRTVPLQVLCAVSLASLVHTTPAIAQDADSTQEEDRGAIEASVPTRLSSKNLRNVFEGPSIESLDASIAELTKKIQDLADEGKRWAEERERISSSISELNRQIKAVSDDIDDVDDAILASTIASAGIPNPALQTTRQTLVAKKNRLKARRGALRQARDEAEQKIHQIDEQTRAAQEALEAKRSAKARLLAQQTKVELTAPEPGAQLFLDSDEQLWIRSYRPPESLSVELQEYVSRPGSSPHQPMTKSWETIYSRTLRWRDLAPVDSSTVSLAFKTGARPARPTPTMGWKAFWLETGDYRVRVQRAEAAGSSDAGTEEFVNWHEFTVVDRANNDVLTRRPLGTSGASRLKPGAKRIGPGSLQPAGGQAAEGAENSASAEDDPPPRVHPPREEVPPFSRLHL